MKGDNMMGDATPERGHARTDNTINGLAHVRAHLCPCTLTRRAHGRRARSHKQVNGSAVQTPECWVMEDAIKMVRENYAIINLDYNDFTENFFAKKEEVSVGTIVGTIGGNLGLFMGFSIMTLIEFLESAFFFWLSLPFLLFGVNLFPCLVRPAESSEHEHEHEDAGADENETVDDSSPKDQIVVLAGFVLLLSSFRCACTCGRLLSLARVRVCKCASVIVQGTATITTAKRHYYYYCGTLPAMLRNITGTTADSRS